MCSGIMSEGGEGSGNFIQRASQIVKTLECFMNSPEQQIMMEHVPKKWLVRKPHSEVDVMNSFFCVDCMMFGSRSESYTTLDCIDIYTGAI